MLLEPVDGADPEKDTIDGWREAWLGTQYALDKANDRPAAVQHINKTCLDLHRKAQKRAKGKFLGLF